MSSLIAAYPFNEQGVHDFSGNKYHLTNNGCAFTATTSQGVGYDLNLASGQNASLGSGGPSWSGLLGWSCFSYLNYTSGHGDILNSDSIVIAIRVTGQLSFSVTGSSTTYTCTSVTNLTAGTWYAVAFLVDFTAHKLHIYINGVLDSSHDYPPSDIDSNVSLIIGTSTLAALVNVLEVRNITLTDTNITDLGSYPGGDLREIANSNFAIGDLIADAQVVAQAVVTWVASDGNSIYIYPFTASQPGSFFQYGNIYNTSRQSVMEINNNFDGNNNAQLSVKFPIASFSDYASPANHYTLDYTGSTFPPEGTGVPTLAQVMSSGRKVDGTGTILDPSNVISADLINRLLYDTNGHNVLDYDGKALLDNSGVNSLFWNTRLLFDSSAKLSIDWKNRKVYKTDGTTVLIDFSGTNPQSPNTPSSGLDIANKNYVDSVIQGLSQKPTADVATITTLPANTYNNGTLGVGATLTGNSNGALASIDGVAPYINMIVLVKNEATQSNNGLYTLTQVGDGSHPYILTRSVDMDTSNEFNGALIPIDNEGTANANTLWIMNYVSPFVVGANNVAFSQVGGTSYTGASGRINVSGTVVDLASGVCTPGTYQSVTVDTYGRITAGSALTNNYQTVQKDGSSVAQESKLNFTKDFNITDNPGNTSTDIRLKGKSKLYLFYNY